MYFPFSKMHFFTSKLFLFRPRIGSEIEFGTTEEETSTARNIDVAGPVLDKSFVSVRAEEEPMNATMTMTDDDEAKFYNL